MSDGLLLIVGGFCMIAVAVAKDPWGNKPWAAALFLLGSVLVIVGISS